MLSQPALREMLSAFDQNDWMLLLTAWMTVLTAAICVLTIAVVIYAKRTLRAARASLDFFSNPVVTIEGERNVSGPYVRGGGQVDLRTMLTICNHSPMDIILPSPLATCCILCDKSSDPGRAKAFCVGSVERWRSHPLPTEPWVVSKTLPIEITLRGPWIPRNGNPLKLVAEFKIPSYLYRSKTYGPLIETCTFLIEPQQ